MSERRSEGTEPHGSDFVNRAAVEPPLAKRQKSIQDEYSLDGSLEVIPASPQPPSSHPLPKRRSLQTSRSSKGARKFSTPYRSRDNTKRSDVTASGMDNSFLKEKLNNEAEDCVPNHAEEKTDVSSPMLSPVFRSKPRKNTKSVLEAARRNICTSLTDHDNVIEPLESEMVVDPPSPVFSTSQTRKARQSSSTANFNKDRATSPLRLAATNHLQVDAGQAAIKSDSTDVISSANSDEVLNIRSAGGDTSLDGAKDMVAEANLDISDVKLDLESACDDSQDDTFVYENKAADDIDDHDQKEDPETSDRNLDAEGKPGTKPEGGHELSHDENDDDNEHRTSDDKEDIQQEDVNKDASFLSEGSLDWSRLMNDGPPSTPGSRSPSARIAASLGCSDDKIVWEPSLETPLTHPPPTTDREGKIVWDVMNTVERRALLPSKSSKDEGRPRSRQALFADDATDSDEEVDKDGDKQDPDLSNDDDISLNDGSPVLRVSKATSKSDVNNLEVVSKPLLPMPSFTSFDGDSSTVDVERAHKSPRRSESFLEDISPSVFEEMCADWEVMTTENNDAESSAGQSCLATSTPLSNREKLPLDNERPLVDKDVKTKSEVRSNTMNTPNPGLSIQESKGGTVSSNLGAIHPQGKRRSLGVRLNKQIIKVDCDIDAAMSEVPAVRLSDIRSGNQDESNVPKPSNESKNKLIFNSTMSRLPPIKSTSDSTLVARSPVNSIKSQSASSLQDGHKVSAPLRGNAGGRRAMTSGLARAAMMRARQLDVASCETPPSSRIYRSKVNAKTSKSVDASTPQVSVGFTTGSGAALSVSSVALASAKAKLQPDETTSVTAGTTSISKKRKDCADWFTDPDLVKITKAQTKSSMNSDAVNSKNELKNNNSSNNNDSECWSPSSRMEMKIGQPPSTIQTMVTKENEPPMMAGFSTAAGKQVTVSKEALERAKTFLSKASSEGDGPDVINQGTGKSCFQETPEMPPRKPNNRRGFKPPGKITTPNATLIESSGTNSKKAARDALYMNTPNPIPKKDSFCCRNEKDPNKPSHQLPMSGFSTASGKSVSVSDEALSKAKELFKAGASDLKDLPPSSNLGSNGDSVKIEQTDKLCSSKMEPKVVVEMAGFSTAGGKKVSISKEALMKAKSLFSNQEASGGGLDIDSSKGKKDSSCSKKDMIDMPMFSTAGGASVKISKDSLEKAKAMFLPKNGDRDSIVKQETNPFCKDASKDFSKAARDLIDEIISSPPTGGASVLSAFSTAGGKKVTVSKEALLKAKGLVASSESGPLPSSMDNSLSRGNCFDECMSRQGQSVGKLQDMPGFSTAGGKRVTISEDALQHARALLQDQSNSEGAKKTKKADPQDKSCVPTKIVLDKADLPGSMGCDNTNSCDNKPSNQNVYRKQGAINNCDMSEMIGEGADENSFFDWDDQEFLDIANQIDEADTKTASESQMKDDQPVNICKRKRTETNDVSPTLLEDFGSSSKKHKPSKTLDDETLQLLDKNRNKQEKLIENKSKMRVRPIQGYLHKVKEKLSAQKNNTKETDEGCQDGKVMKLINQRLTEDLSEKCKIARTVTAENAQQFRFRLDGESVQSGCVRLDDGFWIVPGSDGCIGVEEVLSGFLCHPGVDPALLPVNWLQNHYRWLVWSLASLDRRGVGPGALSLASLVGRLKLRYDREIDRAERPIIRKMCEKDEPSNKSMVLMVACITENSLELTDGWYSLQTPVSPMTRLHSLITNGIIAEGTKLIIHGANLIGSQEGCHPLEAEKFGKRLEIHMNSCRRAAWWLRLGHAPPYARPLSVNIDSLLADGGQTALLRVLIARKYPLLYCLRGEGSDAKHEFLTEKQWNLRKLQMEKANDYEAVWSQVEKDLNQKKVASKKSRLSTHELRSLESPDDLLEAVEDEPGLWEYLSDKQRTIVTTAKNQKTEDLNSKISNEVKRRLAVGTRSEARPLLRLRIVDAMWSPEKRSGLITFWNPAPQLVEAFTEGKSLGIMSAQISRVEKRTVFLNSLKSTQCIDLNPAVETCLSVSRRVVKAVELMSYQFQPLFGEVDLVGRIVAIEDGPSRHGRASVLLTDDTGLFYLQVWGGLEASGLKDALEVGRFAACRDLEYRQQFAVGQNGIPSLHMRDHSTITNNPKRGPLASALDNLKLHLASVNIEALVNKLRVQHRTKFELAVAKSGGTPERGTHSSRYKDDRKSSMPSTSSSRTAWTTEAMSAAISTSLSREITRESPREEPKGNPPQPKIGLARSAGRAGQSAAARMAKLDSITDSLALGFRQGEGARGSLYSASYTPPLSGVNLIGQKSRTPYRPPRQMSPAVKLPPARPAVELSPPVKVFGGGSVESQELEELAMEAMDEMDM